MTNITAEVSDVAIGAITIPGLMDSLGNFYIAVPQAADLTETSRNTAARDFKALMGKDFKTSKLKTKFNKNITLGIPLPEFERLVAKLDRAGNLKAQQFRDDLVGLSLHQLFSDAFKVKFEKEERQDYLVKRQQSIKTRRLLMDAIKDYSARHPERSDNYRKFIYNNCTDRLYRAVFGKSASKLEEERDCIGKLRSSFNASELVIIERHEDYATRLIDKLDIEPQEAIAQAINFYS